MVSETAVTRDREWARVVNLEAMLYITAAMLAVALRFYGLGDATLAKEEASRALSSWQLLQGQQPVTWDEPVTIVATALYFLVAGDSDYTARLVPALGGVALVVSCWLLRGYIGRWGALASAFLLALSPTALYFSRHLSGDIWSVALAALTIWALLRYIEERESKYLWIGAVSIPLLFHLGAQGITVLMALIAYLAVTSLLSGWLDMGSILAGKPIEKDKLVLAGYIVMGGAVLIGTGFLLHPQGLGPSGLRAWITQFDVSTQGHPSMIPWLKLTLYEPLALTLGLVAVGYFTLPWLKAILRGEVFVALRHNRFHIFLVIWLVMGAILLMLAGERSLPPLAAVVIPLTLLAGSFVGESLECLDGLSFGHIAGQAAPVVVLLGGSLLVFGKIVSGAQEVSPPVVLILLAFLGLLVVALTLPSLGVLQLSWSRAFLPLLILGLLFNVHSSWSLNYISGQGEWYSAKSAPRMAVESVVESASAAPRFLVSDDNKKVYLGPATEYPFRWYLRKGPAFSPLEQGADTIIKEGPLVNDTATPGYSRYEIAYQGEWNPATFKARSLWRWFLYREPYGPAPQSDKVVVLNKEL
ncbi:MAG: conserved rane protein of unknown function [Dehalococcoidia bacterium]|nr:conserved rane protein of unknown function [Dehalococcoidia bacterium]